MKAGVTNDIEVVAAAFDVSSRTVRRWMQAGMPRLSGGYFDLERIRAWRKYQKGLGSSFQLEKEEAEVLFLEGMLELERGLVTIFRALELTKEEMRVGSRVLMKFLAILRGPAADLS